jgi:hypothetical protein
MKNFGDQRQPKPVADISSIQQSLVEHFFEIKYIQESTELKTIN